MAEEAISFYTTRNNIFNDYLIGDKSFTDPLKGRPIMYISRNSFRKGYNDVREAMIHELGHYYENIDWVDEIVGGTSREGYVNNIFSSYREDGPQGYHFAIRNSGKYHIPYRQISGKISSGVLTSKAWKDYRDWYYWYDFKIKWLNLLPWRF